MRLIELVAIAPFLHPSPIAERPEVGQIAPALGEVYWYDLGSAAKAPVLADMRGEVVLVHTWGYYCDSCVREGVPLLVDVLASNEGLRALSITSLIEDGNPDDHFISVGREMGLRHALGVADVDGAMTPYLDLGRNKSLTWCFVIDRSGALRWAGDPSGDEEEFLEAVSQALDAAAPQLPSAPSPAFTKAVGFHLAGEHARVAKELDKVLSRYGKEKDDAPIADAAREWLQRIDEHREQLGASLDAAFEAQDASAFARAAAAIERGFPRSEIAERLEGHLEAMDEAFEEAVEACVEWGELARERPASFPARADKAGKGYARKLQKYLKRADDRTPGADRARAWLERFEG